MIFVNIHKHLRKSVIEMVVNKHIEYNFSKTKSDF